MIQLDDLPEQVGAVGTALGLLTPSGLGYQLQPDFFSTPADHVAGIVANPVQRAALLAALGDLLPPAPPELLDNDRDYHPLLHAGAGGQLYLTVGRSSAASSARIDLGLAVEVHGGGSGVGPTLLAEIPLLAVQGSSLTATLAGTDTPISVELRVPVASTGAILSIGALLVAADPGRSRLVVGLTGLPGTPPLAIDPLHLDAGAIRLIAGLIEAILLAVDAGAPGPLRQLASSLPVLLGLADGMPALPFEQLARDGLAARGWLAELAASTLPSGDSALASWLDSIGQLMGAPAATALSRLTEDAPFVLQLVPAGLPVGIAVSFAVRVEPASGAEALAVGLQVRAAAPAGLAAAVQAEAVLLVLPLGGTGPARMLASLDLLIVAPAQDGAPLWQADADHQVGQLRAGLRYDGSTVLPVLELREVRLGPGHRFDRLQLTDADALATTAAAGIEQAIRDGLGDAGAAAVAALLQLLGLGTDPALDPVAFGTSPTRALAELYRRRRPDGWPAVLSAIATLLGGATGAPAGTGSRDDPWTVVLTHLSGTAGGPQLLLALWDAAEPSSDTPLLRLGLQLRVSGAGTPSWQVSASSELLGIDLPPAGAGRVRLLGEQRVFAALTNLPTAEAGGVAVQAGALIAELGWQPGTGLQARAHLDGLQVSADGQTVTVASLPLPPAPPNPQLPNLGLPVSGEQLWQLTRILLARAAHGWAGAGGAALAGLLGLDSGAAIGLPAGAPLLEPPTAGDLRSLLQAPLAALLSRLAALVDAETGLAADGSPVLDALRLPLQGYLTGSPAELLGLASGPAPAPAGSATWEDPWTIPLQTQGDPVLELLGWLAPDGPPLDWSAPVLAALDPAGSMLIGTDSGVPEQNWPTVDAGPPTAPADPPDPAEVPAASGELTAADLVTGLLALGPQLGDRAALLDPDDPVTAIGALSAATDALGGTDGLVPIEAALPADPGWLQGSTVTAAHHQLPAHPDAIDQIQQACSDWTAAADPDQWAVLLLAPELAGDQPWSALLAQAGAAEAPVADLRVGGLAPSQVDLAGLVAASHYQVRLADDGTSGSDAVLAQLNRVTSQIRTLKPAATLILVAHSYAGPVAAAWVAANPSLARGLITLGAPLGPLELPALADPLAAEGFHLARALAPDGLPSVPALDAALSLVGDGLDQGLPSAGFGRPTTSAVLPAGVPALALAGALDAQLVPALGAALAGEFRSTPPAPVSHLGYGLRMGLGLPPARDGEPAVQASVRLDLGRLPLSVGVAEPDLPVSQLLVQVTLGGTGGWLLGGPAAAAGSTRLRRAELWLLLAADGAGGQLADLGLELVDVAAGGVQAAVADLDHPLTEPVLAELLAALHPLRGRGGQVGAVLAVLEGIGLLAPDGRLNADLLAAAAADPVGQLAAGALAALAAGTLFGLRAAPGSAAGTGPWRLAHPQLPVELVVEQNPWRVSIRSTGDGLVTAGAGRLAGSGTVALTDLAPSTQLAHSFFGLSVHRDGSRLLLDGDWLAGPVALSPPDGPGLAAALIPLVGRLLADAALGALLTAIDPSGEPIGSLSGLALDPAGWLASAFGVRGRPDPAAVDNLLRGVAEATGLASDQAHPLILPGGIGLSVGAAGDGIRFGLTLPATRLGAGPGDPTLALDLGLAVDAGRRVTPAGQLQLTVPLPSTTGWTSLVIRLSDDPSGLAAAVDLVDPAGTSTLGLLPQLSGLADLVGQAAARLLPQALDALVGGLATSNSPVLPDALAVATALQLYDPAGGFAAHQHQLAALADALSHGQLGTLTGAAASAAGNLLGQLLPAGWVPSAPAPGTVSAQLPVLGGTVSIAVDLSHQGSQPGVLLQASGLSLGLVHAELAASVLAGVVTARLALQAGLDLGRGVQLAPRLDLGAATGPGGGLTASLRPLGDDTVVLALAPRPALLAPGSVGALAGHLAQAWVLPLGSSLLFEALDPWLSRPIWPGAGKTVQQLLLDAQLARSGPGSQLEVRLPLPDPLQLLANLVQAVRGIGVGLPGGLRASVVTDGSGLYGVQLAGQLPVSAGELDLQLAFGLPDSSQVPWGAAGQGPQLLLLDLTDASHPKLAAVLKLGGLGVQLSGANGAALVDSSGFRLVSAAGYLTAELSLLGPNALHRPPTLDGAVQLTGLGLPLAPPAGSDGGNAIASSLLQGSGSGDQAPANPPVDLVGYGGAHGWGIGFNGQPALRLDVHRTFGPLRLDDVLLRYQASPTPGTVSVGLDGGASIAGFELDVQGLSVSVPLRHPADPGQWQVDLAGLAASFAAGPVAVAGGLLRQVINGSIEYDGTLTVSVAGRGLTAMGSYARPGTGADRYPSLFVFAVIDAPLGGPPYLFVLGLAGGLGYNRRLLVPTDPTAVGSFPLVQAMEQDATSPMAALMQMSQDIPPSRGSYWIAAGIKFSTFELLHTTALVYAALDRGLEIGLLGLMRLALPGGDATVVSLELGLAARYSTVDQVLSIRAALTRNSWLISQDCRVTGGFAFVTWFGKPEAVLTVGGYGPLYQPKPYYPSVDPVGFNWAVGGGIVVKGGAYFALTPDALALGGRLEASYNVDPIRIWFTAYLDVLVGWDPFHYVAHAGVAIGAAFHFEICFFACVTINVSVSLSATVQLSGPPLHALVTVDLDIASVTVEFGQQQLQPYLPWADFRTKYLTGGDPAGSATRTSVLTGMRAPEQALGPDGKPLVVQPDGRDPFVTNTTGHPGVPWPVSTAFTLRVESRLPASGYRIPGHGTGTVSVPGAPGHVDVVPAESHLPPVRGTLLVGLDRHGAGGWTAVDTGTLAQLTVSPELTGYPAATWLGGQHNGSGPTMLSALGVLGLGAPLQPPVEASGSLGSTPVAVSSWVDEEPPRHLPLTGLAQPVLGEPGQAPAGRPAALPAAPGPSLLAEPAAPTGRLLSPAAATATSVTGHRLPASAPLRLRADARLLRVGPDHGGSAAVAAGPVRSTASADRAGGIEPGAAQIWQADPHLGPVRLALHGSAAARVVALSATGAPLHDAEGAPATLGGDLPVGTARVVVCSLGELPAVGAGRPGRARVVGRADRRAGAGCGWQLDTPLLPLARSTLLAHGALVLTVCPFTPPSRAGGRPDWVPAAAVSAVVPASTTVLDAGCAVVIVQLDRTGGAAEPAGLTGNGFGDLAVRSSGATLAEPIVVSDRARTNLVFEVGDRTADELRISVASADWTVAGVIGLRGTAGEWAGSLRSDSHPALIDSAAMVGTDQPSLRVELSQHQPAKEAVRR